MRLWLRDDPARDALGALPAGVELNLIPAAGPLPEGVCDAEFLMPPYGSQALLELLPQMRSLRVIQANSAGVEWLLGAVPAGVTLCSARGTRDVVVAEWVLTTVLAATKELPRLLREQAEHRWAPSLLGELAGARVLIVGYGSIARAVEARLAPFEVQIARVGRERRAGVHGIEELAELLPNADVVVVLVPQTPATVGLFDAAMLARMRRGALLVNAARGPVLDTTALLEALEDGRIRAALDVTDPEPLPREHPLWDAPGLLLTPHLAGDSEPAERRVYRFVGEQVWRYALGEPLLNVVSAGA